MQWLPVTCVMVVCHMCSDCLSYVKWLSLICAMVIFHMYKVCLSYLKCLPAICKMSVICAMVAHHIQYGCLVYTHWLRFMYNIVACHMYIGCLPNILWLRWIQNINRSQFFVVSFYPLFGTKPLLENDLSKYVKIGLSLKDAFSTIFIHSIEGSKPKRSRRTTKIYYQWR